MNKIKYIKFPGLLVLCLAIISCTDSSTPLRVGTNIWPGYEPLYLARHNGYWSKDEIRLVEYPSASDVLRAFRNNAIEAACLTLDEAILLRQYNIPIKIILVTDISHGGDVILSKNTFKSVKELSNKRIGVESTALGAYFLSRALERNSMTINDIKLKHMSVDNHLYAYKNNEIDAVVTFEPEKTKILLLGANEVFSSKDIPGEIVDVIVVHETNILKSRIKINKLINAWFKSIQYMKENKETSYEIIAQRLHISSEQVEQSYSGIKLPDRQENHRLLVRSDSSLHNTINRIKTILVKEKLLNSETDVTDLISDALVKS